MSLRSPAVVFSRTGLLGSLPGVHTFGAGKTYGIGTAQNIFRKASVRPTAQDFLTYFG